MAKSNGEHPYGDMGQLILLILFLLVWVMDSFVLHFATFPAGYIPLALRLTTAGLLLAAALLLISFGHEVISHGRHGHLPTALVTAGAFRYVRHPLYLGCLLVYLALAVATASLLSLALLAVIFLFYNFIAAYEEDLMEKMFGDGYRTYKQHTGKWLPRLR